MSDKLDMSLDDLSKQGRQVRGRGGARGGGRRGGNDDAGDDEGGVPGDYENPLNRENNSLPNSNKDRDDDDNRGRSGGGPVRRERKQQRSSPYGRNGGGDTWKRDGGRGGNVTKINTARRGGSKVLVTNLDTEVNEDDLVEIFEQVGALKECTVTGQGTANVTFSKAADAATAVKEYDAAEVDGRPMYLRLLDGAPARSVVTKSSGGGGGRSRGSNGNGKDSMFGSAFDDPDAYQERPQRREGRGSGGGRRNGGGSGGRRNGGGSGGRKGSGGGRKGSGGRRGAKGGGRKGGGGKGGKKSGPAPTNESLDSDLDSYFKNNSTATSNDGGDGGGDGQPTAGMEE